LLKQETTVGILSATKSPFPAAFRDVRLAARDPVVDVSTDGAG
jgi:hypothetical protein